MSPARLWLQPMAVIVVICLAAISCRAQVTMIEVADSTTIDRGIDVDLDRDLDRTDPEPNQEPAIVSAPPGRVNMALFRTDVDCDRDALNTAPGTSFVTTHVVVDGILGTPCLGEEDPRLTEAWRVLVSITPPEQLSDLALFGGFESFESGETTLAYVNSLDVEGEQFQMSVNLGEASADPLEMQLTMAHEFSHVFTSLPSELDRYILPDECRTWDNGEGCFREDSLIWEWIQLFWSDNMILAVDPLGTPTNSSGAERCRIDPSFLGPYAASNPEEDFAESFSAFVFQLDVPSTSLQAKMDWFARQPGLAEFRDRAIASGLGPLPNQFEICG